MSTINLNFCVDQNIIFCKFNGDFINNNSKKNIEKIIYDDIFKWSNGMHMPILLDLEGLNSFESIKLFKILGTSSSIKSLILIQVFFVHSVTTKMILSILNSTINQVVKNKVTDNLDKAINYCNNENKVFNALN
jgi:hypothetical protein